MCLDKYGGINEEGVYESMFQNKDQRFGGQLVNLSEGRVGLAVSSVNMAKIALTIAIRYAQTRRQFGAREVGQLETLIMDYNLHQVRFFARGISSRDVIPFYSCIQILITIYFFQFLVETPVSTAGADLRHAFRSPHDRQAQGR